MSDDGLHRQLMRAQVGGSIRRWLALPFAELSARMLLFEMKFELGNSGESEKCLSEVRNSKCSQQ